MYINIHNQKLLYSTYMYKYIILNKYRVDVGNNFQVPNIHNKQNFLFLLQ